MMDGAPTLAVRPHWIAVDWGTTNLRAYAMDEAGNVLAKATGPGMGAIAAGEYDRDFEVAFLNAVEPWLESGPLVVVACGMVGSRQGWQEAGYVPVPQRLSALGGALTKVSVLDQRLDVRIVPGLSQTDPFDVMRGEESQLAGYVAHMRGQSDSYDGSSERICLPGTHAKWVRLDGDNVTHFSTAMTGELFDLITAHSILAHSVSDAPMDKQAFLASVRQAFHDPACLTEALFSVRAEGLLSGEDGARARGRVSGLLIGADLAGAKLVPDEPLTIIGAATISAAYQSALSAVGFEAELLDGEAMVLRGLSDLYAQLQRQAALAL